jgi:hypothetical protein
MYSEPFRLTITDLNPNQVNITGDINNFRLKIIAAIRFLPNDENNCSDGGHYILWKKT